MSTNSQVEKKRLGYLTIQAMAVFFLACGPLTFERTRIIYDSINFQRSPPHTIGVSYQEGFSLPMMPVDAKQGEEGLPPYHEDPPLPEHPPGLEHSEAPTLAGKELTATTATA